MKSESIRWNKAGVWICTKCMKGTDQAETLKTRWKVELKELGLSSEVRVMTSSCLSVCPEGEQAILIAEKKGHQETVIFNCKTEEREVFQKITKIAQEKN